VPVLVAPEEPGADEQASGRVAPHNPPGDGQSQHTEDPEHDARHHEVDGQVENYGSEPRDDGDEGDGDGEDEKGPLDPGARAPPVPDPAGDVSELVADHHGSTLRRGCVSR
jgi:hypothetical protein